VNADEFRAIYAGCCGRVGCGSETVTALFPVDPNQILSYLCLGGEEFGGGFVYLYDIFVGT